MIEVPSCDNCHTLKQNLPQIEAKNSDKINDLNLLILKFINKEKIKNNISLGLKTFQRMTVT